MQDTLKDHAIDFSDIPPSDLRQWAELLGYSLCLTWQHSDGPCAEMYEAHQAMLIAHGVRVFGMDSAWSVGRRLEFLPSYWADCLVK